MRSRRKKLMAFALALMIGCGTMQGGRLPAVAEATSSEVQDAGKETSGGGGENALAAETEQKSKETETEEASEAKQTELPSETMPEKGTEGAEGTSTEAGASKRQETSEPAGTTGSETGNTTGTETGGTPGTETGSTTGAETGNMAGTETGNTTDSTKGTETDNTAGTETGNTTGAETGDTTATEVDTETGDTAESAGETNAMTEQSRPEQVKALFQALLLNYVGAALPADLQSEEADRAIKQAVFEMDQETLTRCYEQALAAMEVFDILTEEEAAAFAETEPGLYQAVMNSLGRALAAVMNGEADPMSLLPLEEQKVYLMLTEFSKEELESFSVKKMLALLQDLEGNYIFDDTFGNATTVWKYCTDEDSGIEDYESYAIADGQTINLYPGDGIDVFQFEIIVGTNGQLNADNKRYIIRACYEIDIDLSLELYIQKDNSTREKVIPTSCNTYISQYLYKVNGKIDFVEEQNFDFSFAGTGFESLSDRGSVWLNAKSKLAENPRVKIQIYQVDIVNGEYVFDESKIITDRILNQEMNILGTGYEVSGIRNTDATFALEVSVDGKVFKRKFFCMRYWNWYPVHEGKMFVTQDGVRKDVFTKVITDFNYISRVSTISFDMAEGYLADEKYYFDYDFVMQKNSGAGDKTNYDNFVKKIVRGHYDSEAEAEAAGAEDVTSQILDGNGYLADYSGNGQNFTVFKHARLSQSFPLAYDTEVDKITVKVKDNVEEWREFTSAPIVGERDPWFWVTGANWNGQPLETYVVENGKGINMDTMYGYGYQTIFIKDENADLSQLQPTFEVLDKNRVIMRVASNAGENLESGVSVTDFSKGSVVYTAQIDKLYSKPYVVRFVKRSAEPQLYVVGPKEREVFLDEYFEYKHDILIANMGEKPLTGLKVELNATNVKLDDYWTLGGNGNDTLAGFSTISSDKEYGELPNIAKIRLLPDGDGEIEGTITITADGQEPVVIELTGRARNPKIITEKLDDAVECVPYSYWISTDNMYDWTSVTYELTGGLPNGLSFDSATGEIYGVPTEGTEDVYPICITANFKSDTYTFEPSQVKLELNVLNNTNVNVYEASDTGYVIEDSVGTDVGGYDYVLEDLSDQIFQSSGKLTDFIDLWLNGEKLVNGVDYTAVSGSTKITIIKQTFDNKAKKDGTNTLAAEFRVGGDKGNELKRTAQNFRIKEQQSTEQPPTEKPTPSTEKPTPSTEKPTPSTEKPTPSTEKPTPSTEKPIPSTEKPTPSTEKPTSSTERPTPSTEEPTHSTEALTPSTEKPDTEKPKKDQMETDETDETEKKTEKASEENRYVAMSVAVLNQEEKAMPGVTVEIHSTVQSAVADENGVAKFENVEFGTHSVTVKDANGETLATKNFEIVSGSSVNLNGSTITAQQGANIYLKIKVQDGELLLVSAGSEADAPKTGDPTNLTLWLVLALLSASVFCVALTKRRNRV